jgi:hypothetical protein
MASSADTGVSSRKQKSGGKSRKEGGILSSGLVQMLALPLGLLAVIYLGWSLWRGNDSDALAADSSLVWFMDADGNAYQQRLELGQAEFKNPKTGKQAFKAELCYWTKDGKKKTGGTKVLMNRYKGLEGPTFCPDCGRLVVDRNPVPIEGLEVKVPPTKAEYEAGQRR